MLTAVYDRKPDNVAAAIEMLLNHRELAVQEPAVVADALAVSKAPRAGISVDLARKAGRRPMGTLDRDTRES